MEKHDLYNLMYPVGKYEAPAMIEWSMIQQWKRTIEEFPTVIYSKTKDLSATELSYKYRPHGWSISQVIHHLADSHINAFIRFKLALTEDHPQIKPYHEGLWAEQADYDPNLTHLAFNILEGVHGKWDLIMNHMEESDFREKSYYHPELGKSINLADALGQYDWHCRHHSEHISQALVYEGRFWD